MLFIAVIKDDAYRNYVHGIGMIVSQSAEKLQQVADFCMRAECLHWDADMKIAELFCVHYIVC